MAVPQPSLFASIAQAVEERMVSGTVDLPMLPAVADRILALLAEPSPDPRALAAVIDADPVLTAHILRLANSPLMRGRGTLLETGKAVSRLGLRIVAEASLAACLGPRLFRAPSFAALIERIWLESLATALWAREIGVLAGRQSEPLFVCGLLASIGKPVVLQALQQLPGHEALAPGDIEHLVDAQQRPAGMRLARAWRLPAPVAECLLWQHDFRAATQPLQVAPVVLARALAAATLGDGDAPDAPDIASHPAALACAIGPEAVATLLQQRARIAALAGEMRP